MGYSSAMVLVVPIVIWAKHGSLITTRDIVRKVSPPVCSIAAAAVVVLVLSRYTGQIETAFFRLVAETGVLVAVYVIMLLFVMNQKMFYLGLLRDAQFWPTRQKQSQDESTFAVLPPPAPGIRPHAQRRFGPTVGCAWRQ